MVWWCGGTMSSKTMLPLKAMFLAGTALFSAHLFLSTFHDWRWFNTSPVRLLSTDNTTVGKPSSARSGCTVYTATDSDLFPWQSHPVIPRPRSRVEYWKLVRLVEIIQRIFAARNIECFLYGGSLLGSMMFHDMIPWDDDVDLMIPASQHHRAFIILNEMGRPEYQASYFMDFDTQTPRFIKFYHNNSDRFYDNSTWPYTFVDIFLYEENSTHIWERNREFFGVFPREVVFPLHHRPFSSLWLPSPHDAHLMTTIRLMTFTTTNSSYREVYSRAGAVDNRPGQFICQTGKRDHRRESNYQHVTRVNCDDVLPYYPVVRVEPLGDTAGDTAGDTVVTHTGVRELLTYGETVLHECVIHEPSYAVRKTLSLELKDQL